jgi:uncharacterized protein (DUF433 family)
LWKRSATRWRDVAKGKRCADHEHAGHGCHDRPHISIDPASYSGQPVICWRIPPEIPCAQWWYGHETVAGITENWPSVTRSRFLVAAWWLGEYGSRTWKKRWGAWAKDAHGYLFVQDYDGCPLPPQAQEAAAGGHDQHHDGDDRPDS